MRIWKDDTEPFTIRRKLFTRAAGDATDKLELHRQFLVPRIRPLRRAKICLGYSAFRV